MRAFLTHEDGFCLSLAADMRRGRGLTAHSSMKPSVILIVLLARVFSRMVVVVSGFSSRLLNYHNIASYSTCHVLTRKVASQWSYSRRLGSNQPGDSIATTNESNDTMMSYYNRLLSTFQGDFDNYNQVVQDRNHGLLPGEGGGHEHIHCTLVPCPHYYHTTGNSKQIEDNNHNHQQDKVQWVLAAFYFSGNPRQIFRFRMYQLIPPPQPPSSSFNNNLQLSPLVIRMKLSTLSPILEQQLRECSEDPSSWWIQVWNVWYRLSNNKNQIVGNNSWDQLQTVGLPSMTSPLAGCDVLWEQNWDPSKHSYLYMNEYDTNLNDVKSSLEPNKAFHAIMEAGSAGAIVDSISMIPGKRILIKDELSLWDNEFWINDRGYDPDHNDDGNNYNPEKNSFDNDVGLPFVYGNRRGVPYKLQRVTTFVDSTRKQTTRTDCDEEISSLQLKCVTVNADLEWTLGENYRTQDVLREKIKAFDEAA